MKTYVDIKRGMYRIHPVTGRFEVKEPLKMGVKGNYITVKLPEVQKPFVVREPRIRIESPADMEYCTSTGGPLNNVDDALEQLDFETQLRSLETDEEVIIRLRAGFDMINELVLAAIEGIIRGLIISGPPGIGKSYGAMQTLEEHNIPRKLAGVPVNYEIITGNVSHIRLYQILYNNRLAGQITMFEDCEVILTDEGSLNTAKNALDSGKRRRLSWHTETSILERAGVPDSFDYEGSVIFLTNLDFERPKPGKLGEHLRAIMSRCHYLDLEISNQRDQLLRVRQVVEDGMLNSYGFQNGEEKMIVTYVEDNADHLREISLRMVKKIADLVKVKPDDYEKFIEATCLQRPAKYKRMLLEREAVANRVAEEFSPAHTSDPEPAPEPAANPTGETSALLTTARGPDDNMPTKIKNQGARARKKWKDKQRG